jgi:hypothetical protein
MCTSGSSCNRTVCFFAHSQAELRQPSKPSQTQQQPHLQASSAASASPKQQQQSALLRSNVAAAAGLFSSSTTVPSMQPWSHACSHSSSSSSNVMLPQQLSCKHSSNTSNVMLPLATQNSNVQQQLMLNGYEALEFLPHCSAAPSARLLGCNSMDSLSLTSLTGGLTNNNSSSGWNSSASSIGCGSPTASTPSGYNSSCLLLGEGLAGTTSLPSAAVYRSNSNTSNIMNGSSDLAAALQQLKFVPDGPTTVSSGPAATAGMRFDQFDYDQAAQRMCSPSFGFAGGLAGDLLQPSAAAAAANALLLQQQREQLQQQQLLLAQQEQMLLQQQLQMMNLGGFAGQQMMMFPN